jgi:predicted RNase H-like HicB family nuclease
MKNNANAVGKTGADLTQTAEQGLQGVHGATESTVVPRRQPKSSDAGEVSAEIH